MPSPGGDDRQVFSPPAFLREGIKRLASGLGVRGTLDLLQCRGHGLAILVGDEIERVPDEVDDAGLDLGPGEYGGDRVRKALQPIDNREENVLDPALAQLGHDPQPELGTLGLLDP